MERQEPNHSVDDANTDKSAFSAKEQVDADIKKILQSKADAEKGATSILELQQDMDNRATAIASTQQNVEEQSSSIQTMVINAQEKTDHLSTIVNNAASQNKRINTTADAIDQKLNEANDQITAIEENREQSDKQISGITKLVEKAASTDERLVEYETQIDNFTSTFENLNTKIEGLLPGATSAGLASAFEQRKLQFAWPKRFWTTVFIFCMLGLLGLAFLGSPNLLLTDSAPDISTIASYLLRRLPFAAPIIWLALYAGHHHKLAARLEEDYAYKEAVSRAFEGYKREMDDIETTNGTTPPLTTLCVNTLKALSMVPGRIYEKKQEEITPTKPIAEAAKVLSS